MERRSFVQGAGLAGVLAAGRGVLFVGSPQGEIAQWIGRHGCGAVFGPEAGDALAAEITRWRSDRGVPATFGHAARRAYESQFTFQAALDAWEALLADPAGPQVQFAKANRPPVNRSE